MFNGKAVLFLVGCSLLLIPCRSFARQPSRQTIESYNEGVKLYNKGEYRQAMGAIEEAISYDSDFAQAHMMRGACRFQLKAYENAVIDFNQALRLDPALAEARVLRGNAYYEMDKWDQAVEDFSAVLAKDPNQTSALFGRGLIYLRRDDFEPAKKDFRKFLSVKPDDPIAPELRKLLASLGDTEPIARSPKSPSTTPKASSSNDQASRAAKEFASKMTLRSRELSEQVGRKTMRGEGGEAVGDIGTVVQPH